MRPSPSSLAALALIAAALAPATAPAPAAAASPRHAAPTAHAADADEPSDDQTEEEVVVDEDGDPTGGGDPAAPTLPPVTSHGPVLVPGAGPLGLPPLVTTGTVPGRVARLRTDGRAAIPSGAPLRVRAIIAAANRIIGRRYKWGGGHARLNDSGYDCSGSVSYALIRSGELAGPLVSGGFARWGERGPGAYVTIYANRGHVYMEVAGLRFDTSAVGDPAGRDGVRWRPAIGRRPTFAVRHLPGL